MCRQNPTQQCVVIPFPVEAAQDARNNPMPSLESQIAKLKNRRRSMMEFNPWKPSPFYYLYVPVGTLLVYFLTGPPWWGLGKLVTAAVCFVLLGYLPAIYNRLRFWLFFRWPNKRLHRRIAVLEAKQDRRSASGDRDT